ncbi:MAG: hypothetical protein LIO57_08995 [Oscillospiraceae bacterium]|nr:hypothetical protein [Oscillospiraceae bacterium]
MSFKDAVAADISAVFLNTEEFAERRTVIYDGETYEDIPVVLSGRKEQERKVLSFNTSSKDRGEGIYKVTHTLHCALGDLGGNQPEKGMRIAINDEEGGDFFRRFYVVSSLEEMGMLHIELEALEE